MPRLTGRLPTRIAIAERLDRRHAAAIAGPFDLKTSGLGRESGRCRTRALSRVAAEGRPQRNQTLSIRNSQARVNPVSDSCVENDGGRAIFRDVDRGNRSRGMDDSPPRGLPRTARRALGERPIRSGARRRPQFPTMLARALCHQPVRRGRGDSSTGSTDFRSPASPFLASTSPAGAMADASSLGGCACLDGAPSTSPLVDLDAEKSSSAFTAGAVSASSTYA